MRRPLPERQPTPPPAPLSIRPQSGASTARKASKIVPQFLHLDLSRDLATSASGDVLETDLETTRLAQTNNHNSFSRSFKQISEVEDAISNAEARTAQSITGLRVHARSVLAATEADERQLRMRLESLRTSMTSLVEDESRDQLGLRNEDTQEQVGFPYIP